MGWRAARRARLLGAEQDPRQLLLALKPPCCRGQGAGFFGAWHIQTSHVSALGTEGLWPMGTPLGSADPLHYGHVVGAFGCLPSRLVAGGVNKAGARCLASASWLLTPSQCGVNFWRCLQPPCQGNCSRDVPRSPSRAPPLCVPAAALARPRAEGRAAEAGSCSGASTQLKQLGQTRWLQQGAVCGVSLLLLRAAPVGP